MSYIGTRVLDPETGIEYNYRPDLNEEAPFMADDGEFYTLCGVNEQEA